MSICFPSVLTKQIILGISGIRISLVSILQSHNLVGGWATQLKNMLVKLDHFCKDWVENTKYIWNHHLDLHDSPGACYDCFFVARLPAQTNSPRYLILEETSNNGRRDVSFFLGCLFGFKGNHLDFVCTTTFLDFSREKKSPKNGSVSKNCVSPNPPKTPTLTRNVFSLDDSIKGSYQGYIPAIQKTLSRVFWGGAKETI